MLNLFFARKASKVYNITKTKMDKILISAVKPETVDKKTFFVELLTANETLSILRSNYFTQIKIGLPEEINNSQIKFLMNVGRLLTLQVFCY